jgi:hypothetical protein
MIQDAFTPGVSRERRFRPRRKLRTSATYRERGRSRSAIEVTDLSATGCRVQLQGALVSGEHGWVTLPSLGPWSCSIAWHADREVGLSFDRPLHSAVAEMIADRHQRHGQTS